MTAFICIENINDQEWVDSHNLIFCTRQGIVKKTAFVNYSRPRSNGIIAISLNEGDEVVEVLLTSGNDEILIANRNGRAIRFNESTVRNIQCVRKPGANRYAKGYSSVSILRS